MDGSAEGVREFADAVCGMGRGVGKRGEGSLRGRSGKLTDPGGHSSPRAGAALISALTSRL